MAAGEEEALTLLGVWQSPYAIRARLALNLKGLAYCYAEEEDLFGDKSDLLRRFNPVHKKVPVLIHDGRPVCESQNISEYLDEVFPDCGPRLLPADPYDRAVARFWASYVDDKLLSAWRPVHGGNTTEERADAARQVVAVLEPLEQLLNQDCSKGKAAFFGGDGVGLVDVALGGFLGWLRASEAMCGVKTIDHARTPLLAAWAERFGSMDGVKEVIPDVQKLLEYNMIRRARLGRPYLPLPITGNLG